MQGRAKNLMPGSPLVLPRRVPTLALSTLLLVSAVLVGAQTRPLATPLPVPGHTPVLASAPTVAGAKDALMARAELLYDSVEKSGLHAFRRQVHPDWNLIMTSSIKGAPLAADDPRLPLLNQVRITLDARPSGSSTLDWQPPPGRLDASSQATLDTAHRGIEQTLLGVLKLRAPLVNGSIPESFGEDSFVLAQSENSYTLRSQDKQHSLTELFDRNLLLTQYIGAESGSTIRIAPNFDRNSQGLLVSSFIARIRAAGASPHTTAPETDEETRVALEYPPGSQPADRAQPIRVKLAIEIPNVVTMNFALDTCSQEPDGLQ
jgi:hypothetical protein